MTVRLKDGSRKTCQNKQLKETGFYIVKKLKSKHSGYDWDFQAVMFEQCVEGSCVLSTLNAIKGGYCDTVETSKTSEGCGLATQLMEFCFTDKDVGSVNPAKDIILKQKKFSKWRQMATQNCDNIVFLTCAPLKPTPKGACSAYLSAAINTEHSMMFTSENSKGMIDVLNVEHEAKPEFKNSPDGFLLSHGDGWHFCRCKPERLTECTEMA